MKDDNENKGHGGPEEPGEAGSDPILFTQREINISASKEFNNKEEFIVKGYSSSSINRFFTSAENIISYENNDNYVGEVWESWRHGVGLYQYGQEKNSYFGEWVLGTRHGLG